MRQYSALGDRHQTLERVHLSYCDQITVMAIHYLLQKLQKLNHLSLTGIPAFRRPELQQFCRTPPAVRCTPTFLRLYIDYYLRNSTQPSAPSSAYLLGKV
jgi:hypothetical protein